MELSDEQFALICRRVEEGKVEVKKSLDGETIDVGPFTFRRGNVSRIYGDRADVRGSSIKYEKGYISALKNDNRFRLLNDIYYARRMELDNTAKQAFIKQLEAL